MQRKQPPQQLPNCIRKQQQSIEEEDDDDEREIIKNNNNLNPYGIPTNQPYKTSQKKSDLNQKIRVCVRKRPLSKKEMERSEKDITPAQGHRSIHVNEPKYVTKKKKFQLCLIFFCV